MDEPRDDIDTWLHERVRPLLPPPGTFEQVRKRARRRKLTQAAMGAAGAAVIVAAVFTVPPLVIAQFRPSGANPPSTSQSATPAGGTHSPTPAPSSSPAPSPATSAPPPVPPNFAVSSVTFVSTATGWVIGQAGTPGQCGPPNAFICTSIAATTDGGSSWHGVPAPVAGAPDGARGISQIRSLDGVNGWAFGPQLYATHDGGQAWRRIATHGMRVVDLETVGGRAFAVWASCTGTGPDFAGNCTSFSLYSSPAGLDSWAPVPGVTGLTSVVAAGTVPHASSAQLTLTGSRGYLLTPAGYVISGPVTRGAGWRQAGTGNVGCGLSGPAQPDGAPAATMVAATASGTGLVEMCTGPASGGRQAKTILYSPDGARTWQPAGDAPPAGTATSLAVSPTGQVVVATTNGIDVSAAAVGSGRLRWRAVHGASVPGGFTFAGMTTAAQGVAVPANTGLHAVWFTYDGGRHWQESPIP